MDEHWNEFSWKYLRQICYTIVRILSCSSIANLLAFYTIAVRIVTIKKVTLLRLKTCNEHYNVFWSCNTIQYYRRNDFFNWNLFFSHTLYSNHIFHPSSPPNFPYIPYLSQKCTHLLPLQKGAGFKETITKHCKRK